MGQSRAEARRFTISDGMILVAATAVGLAWGGSNWRQVGQGMNPLGGVWDDGRQLIIALAMSAMPSLMAWTLALLIVRLRRPRPSWRRVARQPGTTACLAASLPIAASGAIIAGFLIHYARMRELPAAFWREFPGNLVEFLFFPAPFAGFSVLVAWAMLGLQRQWRGERGWIDRAGRVLGVSWIVMMAIMGDFWWHRLF